MRQGLIYFSILFLFSCQTNNEKKIEGVLFFKKTELSNYFENTRTDDKASYFIQIITNDSVFKIIRISPSEMKTQIQDLDCDKLQKNGKKVLVSTLAKNEREEEVDNRFASNQILISIKNLNLKIIDGLTICN